MIDLFDAIQAIEKMEVGEHAGEKVSIVLPIVVSDDDTVYGNTSVPRWIKPGKYFKEGRFSASITAHDKDQFTSGKLKIKWLEGERRLAAFISVVEGKSSAVERFEGNR